MREAGGYVTDLEGGEAPFLTGDVVAGNETMHRELLRLLKEAGKSDVRRLAHGRAAAAGRRAILTFSASVVH